MTRWTRQTEEVTWAGSWSRRPAWWPGGRRQQAALAEEAARRAHRSPPAAPVAARVELVLAPPLQLPPGFTYPQRYLDWRYHGLPEIFPWYLYAEGELDAVASVVRRLCPDLQLVPFAGRGDRDDVSCFVPDGRVTTVDFESEPWECGRRLETFDTWLDQAVRDSVDWFEHP